MRERFEFDLLTEGTNEFDFIVKVLNVEVNELKALENNAKRANCIVTVKEEHIVEFKDWMKKSRYVFPFTPNSDKFYIYHLENLNSGVSSLEIFGDKEDIPCREHLEFNLYTEKVFSSRKEAKNSNYYRNFFLNNRMEINFSIYVFACWDVSTYVFVSFHLCKNIK